MSYEIELKAHVTDPDAVVSRLIGAGFRTVGPVAKDDRYYRSGNGTEFRLRLSGDDEAGGSDVPGKQGGDGGDDASGRRGSDAAADNPASGIVTHKEKHIRDGVEYNVEREFTVDSAEAFETLCERIGAERFAVKQKHGRRLSRDGLTAEVVNVASLGWFLEIEAVIDESSDNAGRQRAAASVREGLADAGVSTTAIESRTYLTMLGFRDKQPEPT